MLTGPAYLLNQCKVLLNSRPVVTRLKVIMVKLHQHKIKVNRMNNLTSSAVSLIPSIYTPTRDTTSQRWERALGDSTAVSVP
jgi:hypothetical protein